MANPIWMYDKNTGEGKLFPDDTNIPDGYEESPVLCNCTPIEAEVVKGGSDVPSERDILKAEAEGMGLVFPANIKTDKLLAMIAEAKGE